MVQQSFNNRPTII